MSRPRAFVSGWSGFIGRHFAQALQGRGWDVYGCDVADPITSTDVRRFFAGDTTPGTYDLVVHAAAIVGGRTTIDGEPLKVATDLAIDSDLFQWAVRARPGRVLYFSSSAAYPVALQDRHTRAPLAEDQLTGPWMPTPDDWAAPWDVRAPDQSYGWVKVTGEYLAALARAEGVNVTVVRPFSGYGEDQDLDYPFPTFIARAIESARHGAPFTVWGDGRQVRDFIHVDDVVAGCFAVMESGTTDPVNLGTGRGVSFNELAGMVLDAAGAPKGVDRIPIEHRLDAPVGVQHRVADVTRMHRYYQHTVSLEDGIARAIRKAAR